MDALDVGCSSNSQRIVDVGDDDDENNDDYGLILYQRFFLIFCSGLFINYMFLCVLSRVTVVDKRMKMKPLLALTSGLHPHLRAFFNG